MLLNRNKSRKVGTYGIRLATKEAKMLQSVRDVGIEIGREEGWEEGREEEGVKLALMLLKLKFQEKALQYEDVVKTLSLEQIEEISKRILTCNTIESVFQGIAPESR